jgi:hypothetical protein
VNKKSNLHDYYQRALSVQWSLSQVLQLLQVIDSEESRSCEDFLGTELVKNMRLFIQQQQSLQAILEGNFAEQ